MRLTLEAKLGGRRFESVVVDLVSSEGSPIGRDRSTRRASRCLRRLATGGDRRHRPAHPLGREAPRVLPPVRRSREHPSEGSRRPRAPDRPRLYRRRSAPSRSSRRPFAPRPEPMPGRAVPSMADAWADRFAALADEVGLAHDTMLTRPSPGRAVLGLCSTPQPLTPQPDLRRPMATPRRPHPSHTQAACVGHRLGATHHAQGRRPQRRPRPHPAARLAAVPKAFDGLEQEREVADAELPSRRSRRRSAGATGRPTRSTGRPARRCSSSSTTSCCRTCATWPATRSERDPRDVLAAVFKETNNRMLSGYLLRDVVNKVNEINFASSDDIHTMALSLRVDAARDARRRRRLRRVLHAAAGHPLHGPAGRPEARRGRARPRLRHRRLPRRGARTPRARRSRRRRAATELARQPARHREEAAAVPARHDEPAAARASSGRTSYATTRSSDPLTRDQQGRQASTSILTNPPFGGEEEKSDPGELPGRHADRRDGVAVPPARAAVCSKDGGRCGIVVPNGVLFARRRRRADQGSSS